MINTEEGRQHQKQAGRGREAKSKMQTSQIWHVQMQIYFFCTKEGASSFIPFKGFAKSSSSSHLDRHGLSGDAQTDRLYFGHAHTHIIESPSNRLILFLKCNFYYEFFTPYYLIFLFINLWTTNFEIWRSVYAIYYELNLLCHG